MIRFIASATFALFCSITSALAQPVLTNGGFEQAPPNTYGNNIGWPIAPWVLTAGSANVVGADGPGGVTWYGISGPHSDASGTTGSIGHYLDQANTQGTIYQEFTPLCTGAVRYGAYFSTRENSGGSATVWIKDATGSTTIAGPAGVTIAAGDSINEPWQLAAFTATLTAGTTYRFEVFMDDNFNMDNAYVAFGPECTEHTSPDWSDEDFDPTPDPDPAADQCTPFEQQEVTCNTSTGFYEVTISNSMSSMFNPTDISATTTAPGISITTSPFDRLTLLISGAVPGDFIPISTQAIEVGAGNGAGLDLCCNGDMYVSIPTDLPVCEIIDDPDQDDPVGDPDAPVDVSIEKVWSDVIESQLDGNQVPHGFEITVNLDAGTLTPGDVITVDDPAILQFNVTPFGPPVAPVGWACSVSGASWSCQYVVPTSGAVLPATIVYPSIIDGSSHVLNCASVSTVSTDGSNPDINGANNESCWEDNAPIVEEPEIEVVKTGPASCAIDEPCDFTVTFTNTDSEPYTGNVLMQDQTSVPGFDVTNVSPMPPGCGGSLPANPFACVIALNNLAAGASQTYTITMSPNAGGQVVANTGENCANVVAVPNSITPGDYSWNIHQDGEDAMPEDYAYLLWAGIPISNSCVPISTSDTNDDYAILSVEKTCAQQPSFGNSVAFVCDITVSSDGGVVVGDIDLNDFLTYGGFPGDTNTLLGQLTSTDPWACATAPYSTTNTPQCSISGTDFMAAGGTSTVTSVVVVQSSDLGETDIVNCAQIVNDASEPPASCAVISEAPVIGETNLTITKACSPMPINGETTIPCEITVTGVGPSGSGFIIGDEYINPNFSGDTNGQIGQITGPTGWNCESAPYGNGSWPSCSISSADFAALGGTSTFTTNVTVSPEDMGNGVQNCALVGVPDLELDRSCVDITANNPVACIPSTEIPGDGIDNDCDGVVDEPTSMRLSDESAPEVTLTKTAVGSCSVNERSQTYTCDFALMVENTGSDPFGGPLQILDTFGSPTPSAVNNVAGDDWECLTSLGTGEMSCLSSNGTLASGGATSVEMSLTIPGLRNGGRFENCASFETPTNNTLQAKIVQSLLNDMGIDVGAVDGVVGPNTRAGITQFESQENLPQTGEVTIALLRALGVNPSEQDPTCVTVALPAMPEPPLICDPATTVLIDGACECRFSRMFQASPASCACISGTRLTAGSGCFRPERQSSEPNRPASTPPRPTTPDCPAGTTFSAAAGGCVAPPRASCTIPNQILVNGTCRCRRGYNLRSGVCREDRGSSRDSP